MPLLAYHARTKHRPQRYAAGPETLDWDAQPDPFRRYAGAPQVVLPLPAAQRRTPWAALFAPGALAPAAPTLESLGLLFELSLALSAWKQAGPDRWAVRCTPSSGNLHPTEGYLLARGVAGLPDGLHHYAPGLHALEQRASLPAAPGAGPALALGLSSIHWREAWKYGERAFRYCQLDAGHALGALRYAAAVLGWRLHDLRPGHEAIARCLGLDRPGDFADAEPEEPELLLALDFGAPLEGHWHGLHDWQGRANRLDAHPMYRWPVIGEAARASRAQAQPPATDKLAPGVSAVAAAPAATVPSTQAHAESLIRHRRSAQRFDPAARLPAQRLWPLLGALQPRRGDAAVLPWDALPQAAAVQAVLFAHRIDGLAPGAYLLPRGADGAGDGALPALHAALPHLDWERVDEAPLPLWRLALHTGLPAALRTLSCHQALGAHAVFVIALLADLAAVRTEPARYRELLREAGLAGQVLYLEAEAAGLAGTGIGCYFDDEVHDLLGLPAAPDASPQWQVLYHFSVGQALRDERIRTEAPYPHRSPAPPPP
ncbi:nitroreductase family protein [uncultured Pseudacidovorax sp.]|uniref:nitroreductase family protein n=1 Tax=uncultured Pseudacidovorax sp. TaxID=679313 RepID=UPI0025F8B252|nr:nitroreductase family protein [uncultured Pseudacidovorax sp.]